MGARTWPPTNKYFFKNLIREWGRRVHDKEWKRREDCRQTKMFVPEVPQKAKDGLLTTSRSTARSLIQLMTGHNNLRRHRFLMKMEESPTCERCQLDEETAEHFITECPAFMEERRKVFGSRLLNKSDLPAIRAKDLQRFKNETGRFDTPDPEV